MKIAGDQSIWVKKNKVIGQVYKPLTQDLTTDVVVVGGGSSGALAAYHLLKQGIKCVLVDKFEIGMTATSVTTAILQYEIDNNLCNLSALVGKDAARDAFLLTKSSVDRIASIVSDIKSDCDYVKTPCFYYTVDESEVDLLKDECRLRQDIGISCELFTKETHPDAFVFDYCAGIYSSDGAAVMDPLKFTRDLIAYVYAHGVDVFEGTEIVHYETSTSNVVLTTATNQTITANKVIMATGYETIKSFDIFDSLSLTKTFTVATKPIEKLNRWHGDCIIRDHLDPYHYYRSTADSRLIIGGNDMKIEQLDDLIADLSDNSPLSKQAYEQLLAHAKTLYKELDEVEVECCFNGFFAETKDSLPLVGEHPRYPNMYFLLGYGSNGILYANMGASSLAKLFVGTKDRALELFNINRFT